MFPLQAVWKATLPTELLTKHEKSDWHRASVEASALA